MARPLEELSRHGVSVWLDSLSRELLDSGELAELIRDNQVVGVTSNPTIFQAAISAGGAYDEQIGACPSERDAKECFLMLAARDIEHATELFRPVFERTGKDGFVSWEVDPNLAYDRDGTCREAQRLHAWIPKPNLYVKIPATEPGVGAIEDMIADGKNINVTLIFSLDRHSQVIEAYLRGLERLLENGGDLATVHSVASFFVSRVDTEADKRLEAIGTEEALALRGKLGIANARLAYQNWKRAFAGPRWETLADRGATSQRCLWASTSTKNPAYRDVLYVEQLIGPETVNTMPRETIDAFQDHGRVADTLDQQLEQASQLMADLARVGVDYSAVVDQLEREGVQKFVDSFEALLDGIRSKRQELRAA